MSFIRRLSIGMLGQIGLISVAMSNVSSLETIEVTYQEVESSRSFDGVVESKYQSTVSAQTTGQVVEIKYDVDDVVAEGAVILRLDDTEQLAGLAGAEANEQSRLVLHQEAKDEFQRLSNLSKKQLVPQAELDKALTQLQAAQAKYEQAQAQLAFARKHHEYTVVRAPYSGVLIERHVQVGESVQPGQALLTGFSLEALRVVTSVPNDVAMTAKQPGRVRIDLKREELVELPTSDVTVFPYADRRTHNFKVRIDLPQGVLGVHPGNYVKVHFFTGLQRRLLVPHASVVSRGEIKGVYVVDPDDASVIFRYVVTGRVYGSNVEVLSGLSDGEKIALNPSAALIHRKSLVR